MKKNKRTLLLILLLFALLIFSACKPAEEAGHTMTETESTAEPTTTVPETTPAPTEPPVREASEIKIGMIFYGEENDGSVLTAALREGLLRAVEELDIGAEQILWQYNSREADWTQIEDSILACAESGCQIIFGGAREYASVIAAIAEEYPDIMFSCIDSELYNGKNSGTFEISLAASQYLCGAAAAMTDNTGHIGFLASKGTADEDVTAAVNAFAYGVWSVNPQATVETAVTGKWFLPEIEEQAVANLSELGCQVFGGYTDSSAGLRAAASSGFRILTCGAEDASLYGSAGETVIAAAALYRFDTYFLTKLNQVISREITGEAWMGDFFNQAVEVRSAWELPQTAIDQIKAWAPENASILEPSLLSAPASETTAPESAGESSPSDSSENTGEQPASEASAEQTTEIPATQPDETAPEETAAPESEDTLSSDSSETDEETSPEEEPTITINEETGYLSNIRIHEIELPDPEPTEQ